MAVRVGTTAEANRLGGVVNQSQNICDVLHLIQQLVCLSYFHLRPIIFDSSYYLSFPYHKQPQKHTCCQVVRPLVTAAFQHHLALVQWEDPLKASHHLVATVANRAADPMLPHLPVLLAHSSRCRRDHQQETDLTGPYPSNGRTKFTSHPAWTARNLMHHLPPYRPLRLPFWTD
jgi:hypothetical protein